MSTTTSLTLGKLRIAAKQLKAQWSNDSTRSVLPFIPRPLRFLLLLLLLVNARSLPFNWHIRVFRPAIYLRLRWWSLALSPKQKKDAWLDSLSPIGKSPFELRSTFTSWASPDESDFNMHLSNSSYAKTLDMARLKFALGLLSTCFRDGGWMALGATHYSFIREIPIGTTYEIRMYVGSWDHKWTYCIAHYVSKNKASSPTRRSLQDARDVAKDTIAPEASSAPFPHLHTPAREETTSGSNTPNQSAQIDALWTEAPGETLHCVVVFEICCKHGRITMPPALVLASAGCGVPREKWADIKRLRGRREGGRPSMRDLLRGAWRDIPDGERWWDDAMASFEVDRVRRLEVVRKVREGLEGARFM